jgi:hypothetical protein
LWNLVLLSVAEVVVHAGSHTQGGVQVTTRHTIGPIQAICWLHWPYRNWVHDALRLLQSPRAHPQRKSVSGPWQDPEQTPLGPQPQSPHSMMLQSR